jgi:pyruvate dehydrogenase E2 component (dihydrolipoamide acetyltransferase)
MAFEVVMPRLGWSGESGVLVQWYKKDGEQVTQGEPLFSVEGDKAVQDCEALDSGILRIPAASPRLGDQVSLGAVLAYLVAPGEAMPAAGAAPAAAEARPVSAAPAAEAPIAAIPAATGGSLPAISPRARRVARELGVEWQGLTGSGRGGRIRERDVRAAAAQPAGRTSPMARRVAADLHVDVDKLAAQTPERRITRADVEAAAAAAAPAATPTVSKPMTQMRRVISERMAASAHTTAPVTLTTEVDATELVHLRNQLKADPEVAKDRVPSYNDILAKLVARALLEHTALNSRLDGDMIVESAAVHMGFAVDTERGLLVPVLRDAQSKSVRQIARESAALVDKARRGTLTLDEMTGSTFTITNLGMMEIDAFTPIINLPEVAILGVGRIVPKQVVVDAEAEKVAIRQMMFLSLTFDHRLVDGAPAARFLQRVKRFVERPYLWLTD